MFKLISNLLSLNVALGNRLRSVTAFDEAMAHHGKKDFKQALPLMIEASELGNPEAMSLLGTMYMFGQGTKENGHLAEQWLQRSIDGGYEGSISVLGMAYATGAAGIKIDILKAREMLTFAAEKGDEQSARMLGMIDRGEGMFRNLKSKVKSRAK